MCIGHKVTGGSKRNGNAMSSLGTLAVSPVPIGRAQSASDVECDRNVSQTTVAHDRLGRGASKKAYQFRTMSCKRLSTAANPSALASG